MWNDRITCKKLKSEIKSTIEYGVWKLMCKHLACCVTVVYHPPPSKGNTIAKFADELCELLTDILASQVI